MHIKVKAKGSPMLELDKPLLTATYFGFTTIEAPRVCEKDLQMTRDCESSVKKGRNWFDASERAALIRTYVERGHAAEAHPLAFAYRRHHSPAHKEYSLHLIGSAPGLAEAMLIRTAISILVEEGYKDLVVDVNCIGDKESINAYERELHSFLKKFGASIHPDIKKEAKRDVFSILDWSHPEAETLKQSIPSAISTLTSAARVYFKEVLEYIETLGVEFRLAPELVGNRHLCSHTIFAVKSMTGEMENVLAMGYRYSRLTKRFGFKKEIPFVGITLHTETDAGKAQKTYKDMPRPKFYLVQLGREAKMKTLNLIETLRAHRIPVYHFLGKDKITAQLSNAENLRVPYLLILGQKEALDNTVTIRNMNTRAQDTVHAKDLPQYLKSISL